MLHSISIRIFSLLTAFSLTAAAQSDPRVSGELKQWHKVTVNVTGPTSSETSVPNPFSDFGLNVTFTAPSGAVKSVPGYFAADGNAQETSETSGTVWRAHLAPDEIGTWTYSLSFKQGTKVGINGGGTAVNAEDGATGSFTVAASDKTGGDFRATNRGMLDYVGEHALRWRGGAGYFFKVGMGHPEVFLEFADFDYADTANSTRSYPAHLAAWVTGDPVWKTNKGKGIIGVVNYIASQGVNEHYFLTMNSRGDGKKAFPWTTSEAFWNYDVSKLAQWGIVFDHMMAKGVAAQFVLDECENQMLFESVEGTPSGGIADSRRQYYREMAARFGYLNATTWNIGEENGWDRSTPASAPANTAQRKSRAAFLRSQLTSRAHIVVHNGPSNTDAIFTDLIGDAAYSGVSFQGNLSSTAHGNGRIAHWQTQSSANGRRWVVSYDEPYTGGAPSRDAWRKNALWASLTGGSGGAAIYSSSDLSLQDYTAYATHMGDMRRASTFLFANSVPFWDMVPSNNLLSNSTANWCLGKTGSTYIVYLSAGGTVNLTAPAGTYTVNWFDPRNDAALIPAANLVSTGTAQSLGNPPSSTTSDWAVLIRNTSTVNLAPTVSAGPDRSIALSGSASLAGTGNDDGLPTGSSLSLAWTKISGPGTVSFAAPTVAATTATFSAIGTYVLRLTGSDTALTSSDEVTVTVNAVAANTAPVVSAGPDSSIVLPSSASLAGTASDDGLPTASTLSLVWTKISGPGTVTFATPAAVATTATFSAAGTYVLRLTASDTELSTTDDVTIVATAAANPAVDGTRINAGGPAVGTFAADAGFTGGTVYSDAQVVSTNGVVSPAPAEAYQSERYGNITYTFSGFLANQAVNARLHFAEIFATTVGARVFDVFVNEVLVSDDLDIFALVGADQALVVEAATTANASGTLTVRFATVTGNAKVSAIEVVPTVQIVNAAPVVSAGSDSSTTLSGSASLTASASDDGLPTGSSLSLAWTKISGPGSVTFDDSTAAVTIAYFSAPGTYVLRLTGSDSIFTTSDEVTVTVAADLMGITVTGFNTVTVANPSTTNVSLTSLTHNSVTYTASQFIYGTTQRYYRTTSGALQLWTSGTPVPSDLTQQGSSTAKRLDVGSFADNNIWATNPASGGTTFPNIGSLDGIPSLTTTFATPVTEVFVFERGGNDSGTIQAILVGGGLGPALTITSGGAPYLSTGVVVSESATSQTMFGFVFRSDVPIQGIQINAPGFDAATILTVSNYTSWAAARVGGQAAGLDYDLDGVPNGIEYFTGSTASPLSTTPALVGTSGVLSWTWPYDPTARVTFKFQLAADLVNWTTEISPPHSSIQITPPVSPATLGSVKFTLPNQQSTKNFYRLVVTPTP